MKEARTTSALKIITIEDCDIIGKRLQFILSELDNIEVLANAPNITEATLLINKIEPDVLILEIKIDENTYDMKEVDLLKSLRKNHPKIKIIVLTNHAELQYRLNCISFGVNYFFDKSKDIGKLTDMLKKISTEKEKKDREQKTKNTNDIYQLLTENISDMVALHNRLGEYEYVSLSCQKILGYQTHELIGLTPYSIMHPEDLERVQKSIHQKSLMGDTKQISEYRLKHKNGEYIWLESTSTPIFDEEGKEVIQIQSVTRNISKRKKAEIELKESKDRLQNILDHSLDVICTANSKGEFVTMSAASEKVWGYKPEELIGKPFIDLVFEEDVEKTIQIAVDITKGAEVVNFENRYKHKSGKLIPIVWSSHWDEESKLLYAVARDSTEKKEREEKIKQSEANLLTIFNSTDIAHILLDTSFNVLSCNKIASQWSQYAFGFSITGGVNMSILVAEDRKKEFINRMSGVLKGNSFDFETYYTMQDGSTEWYHVKINPVNDEKGMTMGICISAANITNSKQAELERTKLTDDIIQRSKSLEQFTYIISHNLRAPVANILGISNVLKVKLTDAERNHLQDQLFIAVEKLDEIVKDLNAILGTKSKITENSESVALSELVLEIKSSIQNLVEKENVQVLADFSALDKITTIKSYLHSIFYNLISNSIKYKQTNKAPVIQIKNIMDKEKIIISYKDNGLGIDLKQHGEKLFGLYKRFHLHIEGKGMGLFMVKTQVEVLGGSIRVKSEPNVGTEFIIELPLLSV